MSCQPCGDNCFLPKCAIYSILNRLTCSLCSIRRHKTRKYEDFRCAVRILSRYSIDPRGGYAAFLGLRNNDPTNFCALYIDNIRGEYDPNLLQHNIYHVAFVQYGDMNAVCRTLRQYAPDGLISGNSAWIGGQSQVEGVVAQKTFRAQFSNTQPIGATMPFAGNVPLLIPGSSADIQFGNEFAVGDSA